MRTAISLLRVLLFLLLLCFGLGFLGYGRARFPSTIPLGAFGEGYAESNAPQGYRPRKVGEKYGYVDASGELVIEARFDRCVSFSEGRGLVNLRGLWGYVDRAGRLVIASRYERASVFIEGVADVERGGVREHIDLSGKRVEPTPLQHGRRIAKANGVWGSVCLMLLAGGAGVANVFALGVLGILLARKKRRQSQRMNETASVCVGVEIMFAVILCLDVMGALGCWVLIAGHPSVSDASAAWTVCGICAALLVTSALGLVDASRARMAGVVLFFCSHILVSVGPAMAFLSEAVLVVLGR